MNLQEILSIPLEGKQVLVIGFAASGKSYLTKLLHEANPSHKVFHTDEYLQYGYEGSLYTLIDDLSVLPKSTKCIIEGVIGYRLLRKGLKEDCWEPDIVIECRIPQWKQEEIYRTERSGKSIEAIQRMNLGLMAIYNEYMTSVPEKNKSEFIIYENNF